MASKKRSKYSYSGGAGGGTATAGGGPANMPGGASTPPPPVNAEATAASTAAVEKAAHEKAVNSHYQKFSSDVEFGDLGSHHAIDKKIKALEADSASLTGGGLLATSIKKNNAAQIEALQKIKATLQPDRRGMSNMHSKDGIEAAKEAKAALQNHIAEGNLKPGTSAYHMAASAYHGKMSDAASYDVINGIKGAAAKETYHLNEKASELKLANTLKEKEHQAQIEADAKTKAAKKNSTNYTDHDLTTSEGWHDLGKATYNKAVKDYGKEKADELLKNTLDAAKKNVKLGDSFKTKYDGLKSLHDELNPKTKAKKEVTPQAAADKAQKAVEKAGKAYYANPTLANKKKFDEAQINAIAAKKKADAEAKAKAAPDATQPAKTHEAAPSPASTPKPAPSSPEVKAFEKQYRDKGLSDYDLNHAISTKEAAIKNGTHKGPIAEEQAKLEALKNIKAYNEKNAEKIATQQAEAKKKAAESKDVNIKRRNDQAARSQAETGYKMHEAKKPGEKWAETHYKDWQDKVYANSKTHTALGFYQGSGFSDLNNKLRNGGKLDSHQAEMDKHLTEAINMGKAPEGIVSFRGFRDKKINALGADGIKAMKGKYINDDAYSSTSMSKSTASAFAGGGKDFAVVRVPKGTSTGYLKDNGYGESELLLGKGNKFKVLDVYMVDGKKVWELELVEQNGKRLIDPDKETPAFTKKGQRTKGLKFGGYGSKDGIYTEVGHNGQVSG